MEKFNYYKELITEYAKSNFEKLFREPDGLLKHKFIVPGSKYSSDLWDWDSWLTNIAMRKLGDNDKLFEYEKGCILNFLENTTDEGQMPICIKPESTLGGPLDPGNKNIHKPCLCQHALFICEENNSFEWLKDGFSVMEKFISYYYKNCLHESGLFFWLDDGAIGVDNDPCTFYRPEKSSGSIYLNTLMYKELISIATIAEKLGFSDKKEMYIKKAEELKNAIREHMWDERNGFYYSVDLNLYPVNPEDGRHSGCPRHWSTLIQRIDVWTGFMPMWAGIATKEEAKRIVEENYKNERTFNSPYGVRSLSKLEKMYRVVKSGNPSCWLGPIWGIANYMVFEGLLNYGYIEEAKELGYKTVKLFGQDVEKSGQFHEYYDGDTGEGVHNIGFQSWNLLVVNMIEKLENL
ncbi:MAG: glycoside hydrolase family 37 [Ruminococcaceae bacterium]|nr:glycoside hydrolase family 37 [Oscillospiraceae bacterium]